MKTGKRYAIITGAAFVYAVAIAFFLDPHALAAGGFGGLAIIGSRFLPVDTGTLILLMNLPFLAIAGWKLGWRFVGDTIYATCISSLMMSGLEWLIARFSLPMPTQDLLISALAGGALQAVGIGLIFRCGATTGGTDILVRLILLRYKHLRTGTTFILIDTVVIAISAIVNNSIELALYAAVTLVVCSYLMDKIIYGPNTAKSLMIVTEHAAEIRNAVFERWDIGMTILNGQGAYTGEEKTVLLCVVKKPICPAVCELVRAMDKQAFVIISDVAEVHGEGFLT